MRGPAACWGRSCASPLVCDVQEEKSTCSATVALCSVPAFQGSGGPPGEGTGTTGVLGLDSVVAGLAWESVQGCQVAGPPLPGRDCRPRAERRASVAGTHEHWLQAVASAVCDAALSEFATISAASVDGCLQLSADIGTLVLELLGRVCLSSLMRVNLAPLAPPSS